MSDITRVAPANLPAHLADKAVVGTEEMGEFFRPPLLKIVQKQGGDELLEKYEIGTGLIIPSNTVLCRKEEPVYVVPLIFYKEWTVQTPFKLRGQFPFILYRTQDPTDEIVAKARSKKLRNGTWMAKNKDEQEVEIEVRFVENLNFVFYPIGHPAVTGPFIYSFNKGEHSTGAQFINLILGRGISPHYCVFKGTIPGKARDWSPSGTWYGMDFQNAGDLELDGMTIERSCVPAELVDQMDDWYQRLKNSQIVADYDEESETDGEGVAAAVETDDF